MELYLQFAYGMKKIAMDLSKDWNGATTILSPRDISPIQLEAWKGGFNKAGLKTLFDPQCYYPKSNHEGLAKYGYWDESFSTKLELGQTFEENLVKSILVYNDIIGTEEFIIPAAMLRFDETWFQRWSNACNKLIEATKKVVKYKKHILTIALSDELLLQKEDEVEKIIEATERFDVDGYYIIAHPPQDAYLVDKPMWLINLLQLCAGLKLQGKKVIMGYGNHQLLCLTATGIDAMATGTYLNVRRFTNKFEKDESIQRKSTWYYYPAALSEYKIGFLDTAYNNGILEQMKPAREMDNGYVDVLFSGAMPSSTSFNETMAFKHYLNCVRVQIRTLSKPTYKDTVVANEVLLENAMRRIEFLEKNGVYAQARSFKDMVDVNRSALQRLEKNRGFQLRQEWDNL
ncbi:hypothetical protein QA584_27595 [Anaerocolumna sp. AGMB13025]|uniref:hypothetical protein n=1 Tax=Anaerocolumna sp. AGMB13025 TaxID=3039116 RepID=UPI00241FE7D3|nr:hypothetical protein [Anaerocolumna sp. AGMB13025]WFR57326.1 hypothetical protein QA584_27595 [Anaerocolumna sp. AGMB13025]